MNDLVKIKELEIKLVKLRLKTRHIDFINDYDQKSYTSQNAKSQKDLERLIIRHLEKTEIPVSHSELIDQIVKTSPDLHERDFEKTGSGSIRIYSGIRTAVVNLKKNEIISMPERGQIVLNKTSEK